MSERGPFFALARDPRGHVARTKEQFIAGHQPIIVSNAFCQAVLDHGATGAEFRVVSPRPTSEV
jgi:hypothetical protein